MTFFDTDYTIADIELFIYHHIRHKGGFNLSSSLVILAWIE